MTAKQNEVVRLGKRVQQLMGQEPLDQLLRKAVDKVTVYSQYNKRRQQFAGRTFQVFDEEIPYFIHHYNATWRNERCIEIGMAEYFLKKWLPPTVLELGNVMSYYGHQNHMVVDKYEKSPGVLNEDFETFRMTQKASAFIAISTFEHIGWDEDIKSGEKLKTCFSNIAPQVENFEQVLVTAPVGYNRFLDELVQQGALPFEKIAYLVRTSEDQQWDEVSSEEVLAAKYRYGNLYPGANALLVGLGLNPPPL